MKPIYLDHNATTPLHPNVIEAIIPLMTDHFGNPSSVHAFGRTARVKVDEAREKVAKLINCRPGEIVFTSGGSESNNFAILGAALALRSNGKHILSSQTEHLSVLNACRHLESLGFEVEFLDVDSNGRLDPDKVKLALREDTVLVTIQHANSEVGTLQDIESISQSVKGKGVLMHVDAVQTAGKILIDVQNFPADLLSISAHKIYGPKGTGALYIRRGTPPMRPLIHGGGQELKRRGGTENVVGIVGFGVSAEIAQCDLDKNFMLLSTLRDQLKRSLAKEITGFDVFGHPTHHLPNTLTFSIAGVSGADLLMALDIEGVAVSTGSACSSGSFLPSHVLTAMGLSEGQIEGSLRISLGRDNKHEEIMLTVKILKSLADNMRGNKMRSGSF